MFIIFKAGPGVGIITKAGLALDIGEPAINPVPRQMMCEVVSEIAHKFNHPEDVTLIVSVSGGEELAKKTWNPRLGILGGISILGTTGIVIPYSCSAWIHSIHRGIDVARANGLIQVAGCTGSTSERFIQNHYHLPNEAMLDMGDFVGGLIKYFRRNPLPKLTIGGGFAKLTKLAQGHLDLHSGRSQAANKRKMMILQGRGFLSHLSKLLQLPYHPFAAKHGKKLSKPCQFLSSVAKTTK